ncbi:MAG: TetR/AcrR family transcriptional regulator, partial [Betaproteobacteria bacterium]|nr:TetR/AcrR family transcriptional regulator [Betaproteobacteria bacterium]
MISCYRVASGHSPCLIWAAASGLSIGGLYRHFPSREDVLHALIVHDAEQLAIELQGFVDGKANLGDRITKWCMTQINREVRENTLKLRLEILAMACRHEPLAESLAQYEKEVCMQ